MKCVLSSRNENAPLLSKARGRIFSRVGSVQALYESDGKNIVFNRTTRAVYESLPSDSTLPTDTAYQSHGFVLSSAVFALAFAQGLESVRVSARRIVHRMWSGTGDLQRNETTDGHVLLWDKDRSGGLGFPLLTHSLGSDKE